MVEIIGKTEVVLSVSVDEQPDYVVVNGVKYVKENEFNKVTARYIDTPEGGDSEVNLDRTSGFDETAKWWADNFDMSKWNPLNHKGE